jgi:hypothetical protein
MVFRKAIPYCQSLTRCGVTYMLARGFEHILEFNELQAACEAPGGGYTSLRSEVREWLYQNVRFTDWHFDRRNYVMGFKNQVDAAMFKMFWL